jgi:hypothetical protein
VVSAVAGAMLVAVPRASADSLSIPLEVAPYAIMFPGSNGVLTGYETDYGQIPINAAMAPGTSPSAAPIPGSYMFVWQGANHDLWATSPTGPLDTGVAMAPGTSPRGRTAGLCPLWKIPLSSVGCPAHLSGRFLRRVRTSVLSRRRFLGHGCNPPTVSIRITTRRSVSLNPPGLLRDPVRRSGNHDLD